MSYDRDNIFAKILRGEIPCTPVFEDEFAFAFNDINPQAPVHVLVIPKGEFVSMDDFTRDAPAELITGYMRAVGKVAEELGVVDDGYRLIANSGPNSHQEVPHLHIHIMAGRPLGPMLDQRFKR